MLFIQSFPKIPEERNRKRGNSVAVDIIIPIYNAYDDLRKCLESVFKYTSLVENRIILINDCSPDERIAPYIDSLKQENVLVHHNEKNKGFSGNVNYGFAQSRENDVLLLNTDTVVTSGWLEKIARCAAADPQIGTAVQQRHHLLCSGIL